MDRQGPALVTIAIPTFNRCELLQRAVASARAQDHPRVEIVIVDNHSTDGTAEMSRAFAAEDTRVRYIRQPRNVGSVRNFEMGLANASGDYFCWLADDDWMATDYVRLCLDALERNGHALVIGHERWETQAIVAERVVDSLDPDPVTRVLQYVKDVASNVAFYSMGRTQDFCDNLPIPRRINGDIIWVATMLRKGTLGVVEEAVLHRRVGGESSDLRVLAAQLDGSWFARHFPRMAIPYETVDGLFEAGLFTDLPLGTRARAAATIGSAMWMKADAGNELSAPLRAVLKRVVPEASYTWLRQTYRPVRRAQQAARRRIVG